MTTTIPAVRFVPKAFPTKAGREFANTLLGLQEPLSAVQVDLAGVPAGMITSPFFNGVLQAIAERRPDLLAEARRIVWLTEHEFQTSLIQTWTSGFQVFAYGGDA